MWLKAMASRPTSSAERSAHPLAVVAAGHRGRRPFHLPQRRRHPPGEELHHQQRDDRRDAGAEQRRKLSCQPDLVDGERDDHRGDDDDAELDLDRAQRLSGFTVS